METKTIPKKARMPQERNKFGVVVNCCCASCSLKDLTRKTTARLCLKNGKEITKPGESVCASWAMSEELRMAGLGRDRVKCKEYLMYLLAVREKEGSLEQSGLDVKPKSNDEIRAEFEKQYGSIYIK